MVIVALITLNILLIYGGMEMQPYMYVIIEDLSQNDMDNNSYTTLSKLFFGYYAVLFTLLIGTNVALYVFLG